MGVGCILAPVLIGRFSVKKILIAGTIGWSIYTAALYQNNRYGTEWFVLFAAVLCGASAGGYWAAEGAILLSYPAPNERGRWLAVWLAAKNSGQILAGASKLPLLPLFSLP
jgi:sugar phosphate permease